MTETQRAAITEHGRQVQALFPVTGRLDAMTLCRRLRRIEAATHRAAERECNGETGAGEWDQAERAAYDALDTLLGFKAAGIPVEINGDPRGYALKIECGWVAEHRAAIHTDMGGYGILAPDIGPKGE